MSCALTFSVVVPSVGRAESLKACLDALAGQVRPPDEVIVVARVQDRPTIAVCEEAKANLPLQIANVERPGQVAALNAGVAAATSSVIAITDDDCRPRPDWLANLEPHYADPSVGAVGGRDVLHNDGHARDRIVEKVGRVAWFGRYAGRHNYVSTVQDVQFLKGANMSFRRSAMRPFDERLRGNGAQVGNDLNATLAIWRCGYRVVWDPQVAVDHYWAPRLPEDPRLEKSRAALVDEHHNETYTLLLYLPAWQKPIAFAYALLVGTRGTPGLLLALAMRKFAGLGAVTRGRWLGLRTYLDQRGRVWS
jgi:cellulose synthase/poly-beta-1,6-N-acetylglucosamine synthase-like glycosyltransferase